MGKRESENFVLRADAKASEVVKWEGKWREMDEEAVF